MLIPTDFWLDDMSIESVAAKGNVDDYCNLAILIFAQIVDVLADSHDENSRSMRIDSMSKLWDELQKWHRRRPEEVCPLLRDFPQSRAFPTVILSRSSSSESHPCLAMYFHPLNSVTVISLRQHLLPRGFDIALTNGAPPPCSGISVFYRKRCLCPFPGNLDNFPIYGKKSLHYHLRTV